MTWSFSGHGKLHAYVDGNILVVEGEGPWNTELLDNATRQAQLDMNGLYGMPWAVMTIMRGQAVYIPEAAEKLVKLVKKEKKLGRICTAVVLQDSIEPVFCRQHLAAIYTEAEELFAFFETEKEARAWLKAQLDQTKNPSE